MAYGDLAVVTDVAFTGVALADTTPTPASSVLTQFVGFTRLLSEPVTRAAVADLSEAQLGGCHYGQPTRYDVTSSRCVRESSRRAGSLFDSRGNATLW